MMTIIIYRIVIEHTIVTKFVSCMFYFLLKTSEAQIEFTNDNKSMIDLSLNRYLYYNNQHIKSTRV